MTRKETLEQLDSCILNLTAFFLEWKDVRERGSSGGIFTDGRRLNFIREQIERKKEEIYSIAKECEVTVVLEETPPKLSEGFMVHGEEILKKSLEVFQICQENEDYQYIICNSGKLNHEQLEMLGIPGIYEKMAVFASSIKKENLVVLRKYGNADKYIRMFASCRRELEELLTELEDLETPLQSNMDEDVCEQLCLSDFINH